MTDKALKDKDEAHESNSALDAYGQALKKLAQELPNCGQLLLSIK